MITEDIYGVHVECDVCGMHLRDIEWSLPQRVDYCDDCRPSCCDCGADLSHPSVRSFPAHDVTPDGQATWLRCAKCSSRAVADDIIFLLGIDHGEAVREFARSAGLVTTTPGLPVETEALDGLPAAAGVDPEQFSAA